MSLFQRNAGFTLIEMMIVVVIIAIMASIAYPSYMVHVKTVRRADAGTVLLEAAQFMERFYTENVRYDKDTSNTAVALPSNLTKSPVEGSNKFYDVSIQSVSRTTFVLRAVPQNAQAGDGFLEYTNTGTKRWDKDNNSSIDSGELCWERSC